MLKRFIFSLFGLTFFFFLTRKFFVLIGEPLFKSDLKNPELSHTNIEKERLFRGIQEPNREGSKLFDLSDSDEDGLFSSKMDPKTSGNI